MAAAAFLNMIPGAQAPGGKTPAPMAASSPTGNSTSSSGAATITSNDFLTLLVTEMKNQDPTANRDPNEYINQLVQVNSLQQLISINEVLTNSLGEPASTTSTTPEKESAQSTGFTTDTPSSLESMVAKNSPAHPFKQATSGNLGIPATNPSAFGIAHALDGSRSKSNHSEPKVW